MLRAVTEPAQPDTPRRCAWCAAPAAPEATTCASCGAALAQRESIGELQVPGLTAVDPALQDFDKRPLHLRGPSPSQGMAPGFVIAAAAGGPVGLAALGGLAAVAAVEFLGAKGDGRGGIALDDVGRPSEVVLQAIDRIGSGGEPSQDSTGDGMGPSDVAGTAVTDDGRSIWRDLPEPDQGADETPEGGVSS